MATHRLGAGFGFSLVLCSLGAVAQTLPVPQNVLTLNTQATVEVVRDVLGVAFATTREGSDAAAVQAQLKQALEAALAEARKVAKPGQIDVQTGQFSLYPRYAPKGGIAGWQGSAELLVEGRDTQGVAQLAGRIQTLTIARVGYRLSREAREKVEAEVAAEAIARFRNRAEAYAKQFGFAGYSLREVVVSGSEPQPMQGQAMARTSMASASAEAALPTEAGKASVSASVSGSIQLK